MSDDAETSPGPGDGDGAPVAATAGGPNPDAAAPKRRHRVRHDLVERVKQGDSYGIVLVLLLILVVQIPTLGDSPIGRVILAAVSSGVLLVALRTSQVSRRTMIIAEVFVAVHIFATAIHLFPRFAIEPNAGMRALGNQIQVLGFVLNAALHIWTPLVILRRIFSHREVAIETVFGAICVYILIGLAWTYLYLIAGRITGIPTITGAPVESALKEMRRSPASGATQLQYLHLYFSFITMTTVGYGDVSPASDYARSLAILEVLVGQLFLATTVARFVGVFRPRAELVTGGAATAAVLADGTGLTLDDTVFDASDEPD